MPFDTGTSTVASAGTRRQIVLDLDANAHVRARSRILAIEITPRSGNTGASMYFGRVTVSSSYGRQILKGVSKKFTFEPSTETFDVFYLDADSNGDLADFVVFFEGG